jgi:hypothetical protein
MVEKIVMKSENGDDVITLSLRRDERTIETNRTNDTTSAPLTQSFHRSEPPKRNNESSVFFVDLRLFCLFSTSPLLLLALEL